MVKEQFQKELREKVTPGVKPSDLRKLKRSKSADDIDPNLLKLRTTSFPTTPASVPLKKSQSQLETPLTQPSPNEQITQLKEQVKFHSKTAANYLKSLQTSQAKVSELENKLKNNSPSQLEELDQSLIKRHKSLKDWFTQFKKTKQLDKELSENIDEASTELEKQDSLISSLRSQVIKLKNDKESLQKDLQLTSRLAESRKVPYFANENNWDYLKYALYSLLVIAFTLFLVNNLKTKNNQT